MEGQKVLAMSEISKSFPGVKALDNVSFELSKGEVHGLLGENGAGKSTLMKILGGVYGQDTGEIRILGEEVVIENPSDAIKLGVGIIYQELNLVPTLSVAENIFLGDESTTGFDIFLDRNDMIAKAQELLNAVGKKGIDCNKKVRSLTVAQQQMVEIAKALHKDLKILVMDEPTAVITQEETETLFEIIKSLKNRGVSIIYISHRLDEIFQICDRATILRDGKKVDTVDICGDRICDNRITKDDIIKMMVGRELGQIFNKRNTYETEEIALSVRNFSVKGEFYNISFDLKKGEILGFSGLVGAGRSELMKAIFGLSPTSSGEMTLNGNQIKIKNPYQAINLGIGFVPEDRKREGLILISTVAENISITTLDKFSKFRFINRVKCKELTEYYIKALNIKPALPERKIKNLSGGNQQKAVLSKWLATEPNILILDEPTRGIDVGAKQEIYALINKLAEQGISIIVVSSEMQEVLGLCDRIIVMHEGNMTGEFSKEEAEQEKIMYAASASLGGAL